MTVALAACTPRADTAAEEPLPAPATSSTPPSAPPATKPQAAPTSELDAQCTALVDPFFDSQTALIGGLDFILDDPARAYREMTGATDTFAAVVDNLPEGAVRQAAQAEVDLYRSWTVELEPLKSVTSRADLTAENLAQIDTFAQAMQAGLPQMGEPLSRACGAAWR